MLDDLDTSQEIYTNQEYLSLKSWQKLKGTIGSTLGDILSIKVEMTPGRRIREYNIETTNYITRIYAHNGVDMGFIQEDKKSGERVCYSPYSDPAYDVFLYMACAYHKIFGKKPDLIFPKDGVEEWNKARKEGLPFKKEMISIITNRGVGTYLDFSEHFDTDINGVFRFIEKDNEAHEHTGFGVQDKTIILYLLDDNNSITHIRIEKDLLLIFMQAFVDVNFNNGLELGNLNLKKLLDALYDTLAIEKSERSATTMLDNLRKPLTSGIQ